MADSFHLDSSFLIRVLRQRPPPLLVQRFFELVDSRVAAINEVVELEVLLGASSKEAQRETEASLRALRLFRLTRETWGAAADAGTLLRRAGLTLPIPDLLIATSAMQAGAILVHADSDFDRVLIALPALKVESYVAQLQ